MTRTTTRAGAGAPRNMLRLMDGYDLIIDGRSATEYAQDHVPGAVNYPLVTEAQKAQIEEMDEVSGDEMESRIASANVESYVAEVMKGLQVGSEVLVYCESWSDVTKAWVEALVRRGVVCRELHGGYKRYRKAVEDAMCSMAEAFNYHLIVGPAGVGKTCMLEQLRQLGEQVIDVGSMVGRGNVGVKATARLVESNLAFELSSMDKCRPVWVEGVDVEKATLWIRKMKKKPTLFAISAPLQERVRTWRKNHPCTETGALELIARLGEKNKELDKATLSRWEMWARKGEFDEMAEEVVTLHFDVKHKRRMGEMAKGMDIEVVAIDMERIDHKSCLAAAQALVQMQAGPKYVQA